MKVLVTGSRALNDPQPVYNVLTALAPDLVIHGGCPTGADAHAEQWALANGVKQDIHFADWNNHGRRAGYLRNVDMVAENPDLVVAFIHGKSVGTKMTIRLAQEAGLMVRIYAVD